MTVAYRTGFTLFPKPSLLQDTPSVPGAKSWLGLPGTVTRPGFDRCLNCRWLPRVATRYQPSSATIEGCRKPSSSQRTTGNSRGIQRRFGRRPHLLEAGYYIRTLQELLGDSNVG